MSTWKVVRQKVTSDGHLVSMKYAEFGKGKAKLCKWEIYRDGTKVDYAVNERDAEDNFAKAVASDDRNGRGDLIN